MTELVWYAAYGSNLSRARFDYYLRGGKPRGASHAYPGCRDSSAPLDDRAGEIALEFGFGGTSRTWGGGVALVDPDSVRVARARLYLITVDQFADVVAQENWLEPGSVSLLEMHDELDIGDGRMYGLVLAVGELDGHPVVTFTQRRRTPASKPSIAYLRHIAVGLNESHGLSGAEIAAYLSAARGIHQAFTEDELQDLTELLA